MRKPFFLYYLLILQIALSTVYLIQFLASSELRFPSERDFR